MGFGKWGLLLLSLLLPATSFCHYISPAAVSDASPLPVSPMASPPLPLPREDTPTVAETNPSYCPFVPRPPPSTPTVQPPPHSTPPPPPLRVSFPGPPPVVFPPPALPPSTGREFVLWCVAKPTVPDPIIQEAMNYACGSGADCTSIQPLGLCFEPNRLIAHASFAFNSYWQRTRAAGGTCDFGGTAMLVSVDPSYGGCRFNNY